MLNICFNFYKTAKKGLSRFIFPPAVYENSSFSTFWPEFNFVIFFLKISYTSECVVLSHDSFNVHFPDTNDVVHLFMYLFSICRFTFVKTYSNLLPIFIELFVLLLSGKISLYSGCKSIIRHMYCEYFLPAWLAFVFS